jgi:transposase
MAAVSMDEMAEIERRLALRMVATFGLDASAVALDMTNFATHIDSTNGRAEIAQRGKSKQKRSDLRLVGLGLVVARDGGVPLPSHTYAGNKPDVTQFPAMLAELGARHQAITGLADANPDMTVVFDAGQNSKANFALLDESGLHFIGSIPPTDCSDLLALPAKDRKTVDKHRYPGLSAVDTRRAVFGKDRRVVLTHSPTLHEGQSRGLNQTLAKVEAQLAELADTLARGKTRRERASVETQIAGIVKDPWVKRILTWTLTGDTPAEHRLSWQIDPTFRTALQDELFGKRVLVTDRDDWPMADVVAGYRSQSDAEFGFRQLKDPHVVSFSPMHHWTDHHIRVHTQTCVFALMVAHLMRRQADQAGQRLSVRELLDQPHRQRPRPLVQPVEGRTQLVRHHIRRPALHSTTLATHQYINQTDSSSTVWMTDPPVDDLRDPEPAAELRRHRQRTQHLLQHGRDRPLGPGPPRRPKPWMRDLTHARSTRDADKRYGSTMCEGRI